ncbi:MAG: NAD(P)-dependent oxidoreductase [Candidatus Omnitrophota bacterium]
MIKRPLLRYYPIAVRLEGASALVVGGGMVAQRKILSLLESGAKVKVISPHLTSDLAKLAKDKNIHWVCRRVQRKDIKDAAIAIAATDDNRVNERVSRWARIEKITVNVVDKPALSSYISPAVFRTKQAIVAVYTDSRDPVLSRDLKNFLKEKWDVFLRYRDRS